MSPVIRPQPEPVKPTPGQQIYSLDELFALEHDGYTILKLVNFHNHDLKFGQLSMITPNPHVDPDEPIGIDMEISPNGVHSSWRLSPDDFKDGTLVFIATEEEAAGRKFSYQNESRDKSVAEMVAKRDAAKAARKRKQAQLEHKPEDDSDKQSDGD